jgi:hypothetical protein
MRLIFAPDYDEATRDCAVVATHLAGDVSELLYQKDARRTALLELMAKDRFRPIVLMGHGGRKSISDQHEERAIHLGDFTVLPPHTVIAYACHSAYLGRRCAGLNWCWWGYEKTMQPPPLAEMDFCEVMELFSWLVDMVERCCAQDQVQEFLEELEKRCEDLAGKYDHEERFLLDGRMFLRGFWASLRVWLPGSKNPVRHPDSPMYDLDF